MSMQTVSKTSSQLGASKFKTMLILFGIGFTLIVVLVIATAPPSSKTSSETDSNSAKTADKKPSSSPENKLKDLVKIPDGFRYFSNTQYKFSVAYPDAWGDLLTRPLAGSTTLRASTADVDLPVGLSAEGAKLSGPFSISIYPAKEFRFTALPTSPSVALTKKDNKPVWTVVSASAEDGQYQIGSVYPAVRIANPNALALYDFTWSPEGNRQSRWVFEAGDTFIIMTLPSLVGSKVSPVAGAGAGTVTAATQSAPAETDIAVYRALTASITNTVALPQSE